MPGRERKSSRYLYPAIEAHFLTRKYRSPVLVSNMESACRSRPRRFWQGNPVRDREPALSPGTMPGQPSSGNPRGLRTNHAVQSCVDVQLPSITSRSRTRTPLTRSRR